MIHYEATVKIKAELARTRVLLAQALELAEARQESIDFLAARLAGQERANKVLLGTNLRLREELKATEQRPENGADDDGR